MGAMAPVCAPLFPSLEVLPRFLDRDAFAGQGRGASMTTVCSGSSCGVYEVNIGGSDCNCKCLSTGASNFRSSGSGPGRARGGTVPAQTSSSRQL